MSSIREEPIQQYFDVDNGEMEVKSDLDCDIIKPNHLRYMQK